MDYTNCTIEESEKVFKIIEQYGFKKDFEKSSQDRRRVYYKKGIYSVYYRKGKFTITTERFNKKLNKVEIYATDEVQNEEHLKSFLYYINSSEKPYLKKFITEYNNISKDMRIRICYLKSGMKEQLDRYNNNIKYFPHKNTLKIRSRNKILKILYEIDNVDLY
ncbi:hypothetical protein [Capnocytophaga canis]|uniref:hypothetical protein n=1 Tax=Capnocytophaga canis TaxID=1848903 RepID=UPI0015621370|nr:hypothetical protein [Capnocytophaga canis]